MVQRKEIRGYGDSQSAALRNITHSQLAIMNVIVPLEYPWDIASLWGVNQSTHTYETVMNSVFNHILNTYIYQKIIISKGQGTKQENWLWQNQGQRYFHLQIYLISSMDLQFISKHT